MAEPHGIELEDLLERMIGLGLAEQEGESVQLTLLGRACGRSQISLGSAMRLVEILRQFGALPLTAVRLMGLLQMLREADGGYTPVMKKGRKEAQWAAETARRYGQDVVRALQQYAEDEFDYFGRCKRAALLLDWIAGTPVETLEQRYSTNPYQGKIGHGDIRRFADLTRMNLRSAHQIAAIMFVGSEPSEEEIEHLLRQLEVGIPSDGLALLELPVASDGASISHWCGRGSARQPTCGRALPTELPTSWESSVRRFWTNAVPPWKKRRRCRYPLS